MWPFIVRRLLYAIPTLFGVSIVVFLVFSLAPGDFVDTNQRLTAERAQELREIYGLDKGLVERYFIWIGNAIQGQFGDSLQFKQPVTDVIRTYMWNSFIIASASLILSWFIAIVVGVISASKQYSLFDSVTTILVMAAMSFPSFFIGLLMIKWFAVDLGWVPVGGMTTTASDRTGFAYMWDVVKHAAMPVIVLSMLSIGSLTRYFRTSMLEVVRKDYIRTARAKGLSEGKVIYKHALRNALLPAITLLGFELPGLFAGAIILEQIFNWPGIGRVSLDALNVRDYPLLMGFTMFMALLTVLGNLMADILYAVADPRIRLDRR
ncbi:ABC transporter permease [Paenibacillus sp. GCM10023252]|uniref:ABC transporter permease n=1 Tax=Paenibacillus sp. GCM10023252 TaxID=3252649 RepID=UPI00360A670A